MDCLTSTYTLSNGVEIPKLGFGTWQTPDGDIAVASVKEALKDGYRHIDTAAAYGNEESVGQAIAESGIPREEIFLTTKVWNTDRGYEKTKQAFKESLDKLGTDYLDLYLIHWPAHAKLFDDWDEINLGTWKAMTELYKEGKVRAIGVSNFLPHHLESLLKTEIPPMVNQLEFHPGWMQDEIVQFSKDNGMLVQAYSPLGTGKVLSNETLQELAQKYGKTPAQLVYKWVLQHGIQPLAKSVTPSRILENTDIFDFSISDEDMKAIDALPFIGGAANNPDARDK